MSKELEALWRLYDLANSDYYDYYLVETALKDLQTLLEKYEFETVEDLDNFLMSKMPMVYENGKWRRAKKEYENKIIDDRFLEFVDRNGQLVRVDLDAMFCISLDELKWGKDFKKGNKDE